MTLQTVDQIVPSSSHYLQVRQEEGEGGERYFVNMFTGLAWYIFLSVVVFLVFVLLFYYLFVSLCIVLRSVSLFCMGHLDFFSSKLDFVFPGTLQRIEMAVCIIMRKMGMSPAGAFQTWAFPFK